MNEEKESSPVEEQEDGISLIDLWHIFLKHIWAIFIIVVVCGVGGFAGGKLKTKASPNYQANATMLVSGENTGLTDSQAYQYANTICKTFTEFIVTKPVISKTAEETKISEDMIKSSISTSYSTNSLIIKVHCTMEDKKQAVEVVNSLVKNSEIVVNTKNEDDSPKYKLLYGNVSALDEAEEKDVKLQTSTKKFTLIGFAGGVVVAICYVFIKELTDKTFKSNEEIEKLLGLPVLASVPTYDFKNENKEVK